MRVRDKGAYFAVSLSAEEVEAWKRRWPASGLPSRSVTFEFEKRNGDLVDITPYKYAHLFDGAAAVALSEDAKEYGVMKLGSQ